MIFVFIAYITLTTCAMSKVSSNISDQIPTKIETASSVTPSFEIFCDFQCPYCARFFITLFSGARYEGKEPIYELKHLPLPFHPGAETLARFYEAAILNHPSERDELIESLYRFKNQRDPQQLINALSIAHNLDSALVKRDLIARDVSLTYLNLSKLLLIVV